MSNNAAHDHLCNRIALELSRRRAMVHQAQASGKAVAKSGAWMTIGKKGKADVRATLPPLGRDLAVEVKTGKAVLSEDQENWRDAFVAAGGLHFEARSFDSFLAFINQHLPEPEA